MALAATAQKPDPKATLSALGGGSFGGLLSGAQSNVAREMQEITPEISRMQRQQKQDRASVASFESKMQPVDLKPWTAQPPAPNPLHAFGSIAGIFAVLASAFTHTPAISAMNGMAAAINARRNNDEEGYKQAYKAWQDNSKLAVERAQLENAEMQTALQKLSTDVQAGVADVKMISAKYGDKTSLELAEAGLFNQLGMVQAARESAAAKMEQVRIQAETFGQEFGFPQPPEKTGAPASGTREGAPSSSANAGAPSHGGFKSAEAQASWYGAPPPNAPYRDAPPPDDNPFQTKAWLIAHYKMAPPAGFGTSSAPANIALTRYIYEFNPNYDQTIYARKSAAMNAFGSGPLGNQVRSFNVAISHLETAQRLAGALNSGPFPWQNAAFQEYARETGQPAPTNYAAAQRIVGQEVNKAIVAGGGGETEREQAAKSLAAAGSPAQISGVIRTYEDLMGGQLRGLERQYFADTGMPDFPQFLSPQAKTILSGLNEPTNAMPLPTVVQNGRRVPDAPKLKDGQSYTLPDGRIVKFDAKDQTFVPEG